MCGRTPPKAMVARMRVSSSSSPRIASCKCRGVIRLTFKSFAAFYLIISPSSSAFAKLGTYSCELENLSCKIFEDCCNVDGCLGSNAHLVLRVVLQETLDTTTWELNILSQLGVNLARAFCDSIELARIAVM